MQKNQIPLLKKKSQKPSCRHKTQTKTNYSTLTSSFVFSRRQLPQLAKTKDILEQAIPKIEEGWLMIEAMGMESAQSTIFKYLRKYMEGKSYHYTELIFEILLNRSLPRGSNNKNVINGELLNLEIDQMKEELENYLLKRFNKDMSIMREKIEQADHIVKDCVDIDHYEQLVLSFRPQLITTNSTNLAHEYQVLLGPNPANTPRCVKLQQFRFHQLARLEQEVCALHNRAVEMKSGTKMYSTCLGAISSLV